MLDANFWHDKSDSTKILKEKKLFENLINSYETSLNKLNDLDDLNKLAIEENNINIQSEIFDNIKELRKLVKKNEIKCFLSNESDSFERKHFISFFLTSFRNSLILSKISICIFVLFSSMASLFKSSKSFNLFKEVS